MSPDLSPPMSTPQRHRCTLERHEDKWQRPQTLRVGRSGILLRTNCVSFGELFPKCRIAGKSACASNQLLHSIYLIFIYFWVFGHSRKYLFIHCIIISFLEPTTVECLVWVFSVVCVCLFVFFVCLFFHTISQKPMQLYDHQTWHNPPWESWKLINFGLKKSKVKVTRHKTQCRRGLLLSCECWLL